jgi:CelD/BcsL family acetyltransferase involved in cellulose biosynthesis
MNFYASREYLDAAASVYFKGRAAAVEDVKIGGDVLRLLVVDGRIVTELQFLDFHQPLAASEVRGTVRKGRYAQNVVRGVIGLDEGNGAAVPECELAPFIDWSGFRSFEEYKARLLKRHKGLVRDRERRWRSLAAAHGEPVFTMDDRAADVLDFARHWKSSQLRETGISDWASRPEMMEFLETLRERNLLVSSTLRAGGRLVAVWIGFVHEGVWSGWIFTYDPAFRKYSAGHQLIACMLEESFRLGHREFDFSDGGHDYKMMYATHARLLGEIGRPPPARAAVIVAKAALRRLSPGLLQAVQNAKRTVRGWFVRHAAAKEQLGIAPLHRVGGRT